MRRTRSQYEVWVDKILRSRTIGCLPGCILWICIALVFLGYLTFHDLPNPFDFIRARLLPSSPPPIVFVARDNLPMFTVLTKANFDIEQNSQHQNAYNSSQVEQRRQLFYNRITLRPYAKGEAITLSDLGPKVSSDITFQVREIDAMSTFSWMHIGDTLNFLLIDTACSSQNATPTVTSSECLSQASSHMLLDVVILQVGTVEKDGTTPLLVAIPSVENKEELPLLDHDIQHIIAYPETIITAVKAVNLYL
jgi:hypothetical protein